MTDILNFNLLLTKTKRILTKGGVQAKVKSKILCFQYCSDESEHKDPDDCQKWRDTTLMKQCKNEQGEIVKCGFLFSETG